MESSTNDRIAFEIEELENNIRAYEREKTNYQAEYIERSSKYRHQYVAYLFVIILSLIISYFLLISSINKIKSTIFFNSDFIKLTIFVTVFIPVAGIMNTYLKINDLRSARNIKNAQADSQIEAYKLRLKRLLEKLNHNSIEYDSPYISQLNNESQTVVSTVPNITFYGGQENTGGKLISDKQSIVIDDLLLDCQTTRSRLLNEIGNLKGRGQLNLIVGSLTTLAGMIVLLLMLFSEQKFSSEGILTSENLHYYLSRITTVIFIEVFSFFFLRLYRNSLSDIKYYQNELTNLESRFLSLKSALYLDNAELRTQVVQEIMKTERNPIISADQTNLINSMLRTDNEKDRSFIDGFKSGIESISSVFEKNNKVITTNTELKPNKPKAINGKFTTK